MKEMKMAHPTSGRSGFQSVQPKPHTNSIHIEEKILCHGCGNALEGIRFKCSICPSYDLCGNCLVKSDNTATPSLNLSNECAVDLIIPVEDSFDSVEKIEANLSSGEAHVHDPGHIFWRIPLRSVGPRNPSNPPVP
jgi:hypothetical protein